ncbi:MAG: hypothetical protein ACE5K1_03600 [Acidiferrobacterales bacterium]
MAPRTHQNSLIATLVATAVLIAGCVTAKVYDGPERPPGDIATIRLPVYDSGFPGLRIHKVDETLIPRLTNEVKVSPGMHNLLISCNFSEQLVTEHAHGRATLRFMAASGRSYKVRTSVSKGRCMLWIEDAATGAIVSEQVEG